jgi:phosphotransacetylase/acyl dehydratase
MIALTRPSNVIESKRFEDIFIGKTASLSRTITQRDIDLFASATGDINPAHVDPAYAARGVFHHIVAHGLLGAGLISAVLGTKLPGPGTIYLSQDLQFLHPIEVGDTITATVTVREKHFEKSDLSLDCRCTNQNGDLAIAGTARVRVPRAQVQCNRVELPDVFVARHERLDGWLSEAARGDPISTAVAFPCDQSTLSAAVKAAKAGIITPILVGPRTEITKAADEGRLDISGFQLVDASTRRAAAEIAVDLAQRGEAQLLMKGSLHTDELLHAVLEPDAGLCTERRLSHVYLMDVPCYPRLLIVTDAAVNISPSLQEKADIIQNAIDFARLIGITHPRVAILAAVETINAKMSSTLDAAALCKMAERGQISGGSVDGPLALDNAVSSVAAAAKGIVSRVAGQADILVAPDLEAGNLLAKELVYFAKADAAGIVLGADVPIILTSRADSERTRLFSCALAVLAARARAEDSSTSHMFSCRASR